MRFSTFGGPGAVVKGAPYSATITNESVQTFADGNTHRAKQRWIGRPRFPGPHPPGRTPLPMIGGLAASDAPHLVMIQDPVANVGYTLNLTDKTAWKHGIPPGHPGMAGTAIGREHDRSYVLEQRCRWGRIASSARPRPMCLVETCDR